MKLHRFHCDTPDPKQRGQQIGQRFAAQIAQTLILYLDFFRVAGISEQQVRKIGENSMDALHDWCAPLAEELCAMAEGAKLPLWQLASLNARTEVLAAMPKGASAECSTAVFAPQSAEPVRSMQTWDWHDALVPEALLLHLHTAGGRQIKLFSEFGMLGKIGVNNAGVGLHFNILHHQSDHADGGVPVHAVARLVLEQAQSVSEAIELAQSARVSASTVLTVFSHTPHSPRAACIELSPAGACVVLPSETGWLSHTNHFLDPTLSQAERSDDDSTRPRIAHLNRQQHAIQESLDTAARARAFCGDLGEAAPICFIPDPGQPITERWETLLTIAIDCADFALEYATGNPMSLINNGHLRF
ncbi:peptidase C45 [Ventosimonas gracilis]|uniref:Peptidase C45 n=1 Tax=Ventosimonas gracilis TaxID=1680762 RepID=A0A139SMM6_9GAMM|nr:C45 family peptidase [Ventosimonas gracilis]KXU35734.1 peptidase C45 [Ventosimonas gracilis]